MTQRSRVKKMHFIRASFAFGNDVVAEKLDIAQVRLAATD